MVEVRRAGAADCPGIAKIQVDSYRTAYAGSFPETYLQRFSYEEQEQDWLELLSANSGDVVLVAVSADEQVMGYALARAEIDVYPGYDAEILALHVGQRGQGRGIGTALLRATVAELREQGCSSVMLWTLLGNPVRRWYERLQGRLVDERSYRVDGWDVVEVAYGWESILTLLQAL
jgi:ribosomal protein S18 acetylase RimI-like enzyme